MRFVTKQKISLLNKYMKHMIPVLRNSQTMVNNFKWHSSNHQSTLSYTHSHMHTYTHLNTHARTHTCTHACARTHTKRQSSRFHQESIHILSRKVVYFCLILRLLNGFVEGFLLCGKGCNFSLWYLVLTVKHTKYQTIETCKPHIAPSLQKIFWTLSQGYWVGL